MSEHHNSIRLVSESDEYEVTSVVAVAPTWRDVWAILRGRYEPKVMRRRALTTAGYSRMLKRVWTRGAVTEQMYGASPFLDLLKGQTGVVPIYRDAPEDEPA